MKGEMKPVTCKLFVSYFRRYSSTHCDCGSMLLDMPAPETTSQLRELSDYLPRFAVILGWHELTDE